MSTRTVGRKATQAVIARAAGVSVPTVSKVLNGRPDVSPHTRQRVEALLTRYGYVPTPSRDAAHYRVVEVVLNDLDGTWGSTILAAVEDVLVETGLGMNVSTVRSRSAPDGRNATWYDAAVSRRPAGMLLALVGLTSAQRRQLGELGIPYVILDPVAMPGPDVPSVGATNWAGGLAATEHLLALGHRRIAIIGGPPKLLCSRARLDGYRAALSRAGVEIRPEYIRAGDFHSASGYRATGELLALPEPPTAVFACSDPMALGAYRACRDSGIGIPDQLSVVGFDDLPEAQWVEPSLTTVRQPLADMTRTAMRFLLDAIEKEAPDSRRVELATPLVERDSAAPLDERGGGRFSRTAPAPGLRVPSG